MTYSTVYSIHRPGGEDGLVSVKEAGKELDEKAPGATAYVVGIRPNGDSICHGQPREPIPRGATVYYDGTVPWTWDTLATAFPQLPDDLMPHEYYGEPTALSLTTAKFKRVLAILAATDKTLNMAEKFGGEA